MNSSVGSSIPANYGRKRPVAKMSEKADAVADRKAGIKPGSKRDNALDKRRGVPTRAPSKTGRKSGGY